MEETDIFSLQTWETLQQSFCEYKFDFSFSLFSILFLHSSQDNKAIQITIDHNLSKDNGIERERLANSGIKLTEGQTRLSGLGVTRALGDFFAKEEKVGITALPSVSKPIKITDSIKFMIVASDGV